MAAKGTTKNSKTTVVDSTVNARTQQAEDWWYNLSNTEQDAFREKFKSQYSPTNEEILAAYDSTHEDDGVAKPATPEQAQAWWQGLSRDERAALRDKFADPPEDVTEMYDAVHKSGRLAAEQQATGEEPPTVQAATPYASATNPELMRNDAIPGEDTALYASSPWPEGYKPPPPPEVIP